MLKDREIIREAIDKSNMPDRLLKEIVVLSVLIDGTILSGGGPSYEITYDNYFPNIVSLMVHERSKQLCDLFFSREFGTVHRRPDIHSLFLSAPYNPMNDLGIRYGLLHVKRTDWTQP